MKELGTLRMQSAATALLNSATPRVILEAVIGTGAMSVMAHAAGKLPKTDGLLIIAPRAFHNQWGRELQEFGDLGPLDFVMTTAAQLLDPHRRRRMQVLRNVIVNHIHTGPATIAAIAEVANAAKRVWVRDVDRTERLDASKFVGPYLRLKL